MAHSSPARTAVGRLARTDVWRDVLLVLGGSMFVGLAAQLSWPLYGTGVAHPLAAALASLYSALGVPLPNTPVPLTGQTLAVLLVGACLKPRLAFLSLAAYLAEGLAGLPVFALARSAWSPSTVPGLPWLLGPTAGYLLALPLAAYVVSWLVAASRRPGRAHLLSALLVGELVVFFGGVMWLAGFVGLAGALTLGLAPFVAGEVVKVALAMALLPAGRATLSRFGLGL
ncbi:MAG: biotin transporter BioY [Chloroflexota bacterium]